VSDTKERFSVYHEFNPLTEGMTKELFFERSFSMEPSDTFSDFEKMKVKDCTRVSLLGGYNFDEGLVSYFFGEEFSVLPKTYFSWGYSYSSGFIVYLAFTFRFGEFRKDVKDTDVSVWANTLKIPGLDKLGSIFDEKSSFDFDPSQEIDPFILLPISVFTEEDIKTAVFPCFVTRDLFLVPQTLEAGNLDSYLRRLAKFYLLTFVKVHNMRVYFSEKERIEKVGKSTGGSLLN
jgi:hypothetical protein